MKNRILFAFAIIVTIIITFKTTLILAVDEPITVTGNSVWGDTKKKITYMEGNVRVVQEKTVITADKGEFNLDHKIAVLTGQVKLVTVDATITADTLEYDLRKKIGTFKINCAIIHKDFNGSATEIDYNYLDQLLTLKGNALLKRPQGEEVKGELITINIRDKSFKVKDKATLSILVEETPTPTTTSHNKR